MFHWYYQVVKQANIIMIKFLDEINCEKFLKPRNKIW